MLVDMMGCGPLLQLSVVHHHLSSILFVFVFAQAIQELITPTPHRVTGLELGPKIQFYISLALICISSPTSSTLCGVYFFCQALVFARLAARQQNPLSACLK